MRVVLIIQLDELQKARFPIHATSPMKARHSFPIMPNTHLTIFIFKSFQPVLFLFVGFRLVR